MTEEKKSLIEFPCDFPIKVMGHAQDGFAQAIVELLREFDAQFDAATVEMRPSSTGKYLGLTVTVRAHSQAHLDDIYRKLTSHPMVKVVL
ncbi:HP0495 family protein [Pandoraea sputorum]|uniref:UPF0250 protein PSP31121_00432 n=1 Tax=Pandoraea sputorum TaxID=93222 RepID=A0A239S7N2_9BURK|nr:DUF493 family protein [Pandoraea sputorum]AJC15814.1 hypothetical protein NA29_06585 [Pandoraea sputorum]MCE4060900.1 DUF493 family protein [Pandoraea sputorum]SNU81455.1 Uncharacterized conserved protein [Pandoraea sputorum]VVD66834.1 hypothetical protein PSP20601_00384 [Pandoraea sputorum]VVE75188.1 hypothetical protein PSP31121_00432 [Pandoraea sputorum]